MSEVLPYKLGKQNPLKLMETPSLGDHMESQQHWPEVKARGWEYAVAPEKLECLGNDKVGNCAIAMAMHHAQIDTAAAGNPLTPTEQLTLETYSAITGYDPKQTDENGDNPTDQGTTFIELFRYWKNHGIPLLDVRGNIVMHKILGWAALDLNSVPQQRYACDTFGCTLTGIKCARNLMTDTSDWVYDPKSPILGGHGVLRAGQGAIGQHFISWGFSIPAPWSMSLHLADEDFIVTTPFWLNRQGVSPSGLDLNGLLNAFSKL